MTYAKCTQGKGKGKVTMPTPSPPLPLTKATSANPHPQSLLNKPKKQGLCPLPAALLTTDYVVILDHTALVPPTRRPADVSIYVCKAQESLKAAQVDVTLLASRWSSPGSG
jgi:hypothetical protein